MRFPIRLRWLLYGPYCNGKMPIKVAFMEKNYFFTIWISNTESSINIIQILWATGHHHLSNIFETDCQLRVTTSIGIEKYSGRKPFVRPQHSRQTLNPQISSITATTAFSSTSSHRVLMVLMCLLREYQHNDMLKSYFLQTRELHETWFPPPQMVTRSRRQNTKFPMASSTHILLTDCLVSKRNPTRRKWYFIVTCVLCES